MISETTNKYPKVVLLFFLLSLSVGLLTFRLNQKVVALRKLLVFFVLPGSETADQVIEYGFSVSKNIYELIKIKRENARLREENGRLSVWKSEFEDILEENQRLRNVIDFKQRSLYETLVIRVISRNSTEWFFSCICDKGSSDGVMVDDVVVAVQGEKTGLVGRVVEVTPGTSKILLLTDSLSSAAVYSKRASNDGIVQGKGSPELTLKYIIPDTQLEPGDELLTAGTGGVFPPGLPVGNIIEVSPKKFGDFREAKVMPAINFGKLRELVVVKFVKQR